jgi:hypothetical protein
MLCEAEMTINRYDVGPLAEHRDGVLRLSDTGALFDMWDALRGGRAAPFRAELDAGKIGARTPYLAIFEQVGESNFRVRIAGDRLNAWFGLELRGMSALALATPACRNHLQATLNRVTAEPAAAVISGVATAADGDSAGFECVLLPMRSDFGPVDRVLFGMWLEDGAVAPAKPVRLRISEIAVSPIAAEAPAELAPAEVARPPRAAPATPAPAAPAPEVAAGERAPAREVRRGHLRLVVTDGPGPQRRR